MNLPTFSLLGSDGRTYTDADFQTGKYVIYAYPKDMTPGCTIQANHYQSLQDEFANLDVQIFGISADDDNSHQKFCQKESLDFVLLSDPEKKLLEPIGAWREKNLYGRKFMGIARSTYLIQDGEIVKVHKAARAKSDAQKVLEFWQNQ